MVHFTRESARSIEALLLAALEEGSGQVELDFSGVDGLSPSFFAETLEIVREYGEKTVGPEVVVTMKSPPTTLSAKFLAVARAFGVSIAESDEGAWVISRRPHAAGSEG